MDKEKQPGIKINGIILAESYFKRTPNVSQPIPLDVDIKVSNNITNEEKQLVTELRVTLNSETDSVYGYFVFVGVFSTDSVENMSLSEFSKNHAPAHIFPYIREEIQSRSVKAGLPPIILQPVNLHALN